MQDLAADIDLETPSGTNLIEVTYSSSDPVLAFGVLNSLSTIFLEKHAQPQDDKAAMEDAEAGLRALARKPIVIASVPALKQRSDLAPSRSPTRQAPQTAQQLLKKLATNLLDAETKRTQLLLKYETSHPLVKEANQQIAAIKEAIAEGNRAKDEQISPTNGQVLQPISAV